MDTEQMIRELRRLAEEHKNDMVFTFETNWSLLCSDVANELEYQEKRYSVLYNDIKNALGEERYEAARKEVLDAGNYSLNAMLTIAITNLREEVNNLQEDVAYLEGLCGL